MKFLENTISLRDFVETLGIENTTEYKKSPVDGNLRDN